MLVHGGGCIAICGWGGRWKRWRGYDDGLVGRWMDSLGACPNRNAELLLLSTPCGTLPLTAGVQQECGPLLRKGTPTTTPNPPHNTDALHGARGPGLERVIAAPGEAPHLTTYRWAYLWGLEAEGVSALRRHTWREHPTEEAEINHPTGRDAGSPSGGIGSIGGAPSGAQPYQGGWGRQGEGGKHCK